MNFVALFRGKNLEITDSELNRYFSRLNTRFTVGRYA